MPLAVFSGQDTHPANSLALMLKSVGYDCVMLDDYAITRLQKRGYIGGVSRGLLQSMGYSEPNMPYVGIEALDDCEMFVDLKSKWIDSFKTIYPNVKVLHHLINGGVDDYQNCGFLYPVVTPNRWIEGKAFMGWMPFDNVNNLKPRGKRDKFEPPIGLIHSIRGWGFAYFVDPLAKEGVRFFGAASPMGVLQNEKLGPILENTLANVHLKTNDCPGWALVETMMAGVPLVVCELMFDRMKMRDMYENNVTCISYGSAFYDREVTEKTGIAKEWYEKDQLLAVEEIKECIEKLKDPELNYQIGMAGYERCKQLLEWTEDKREAFRAFLKDNGFKTI